MSTDAEGCDGTVPPTVNTLPGSSTEIVFRNHFNTTITVTRHMDNSQVQLSALDEHTMDSVEYGEIFSAQDGSDTMKINGLCYYRGKLL